MEKLELIWLAKGERFCKYLDFTRPKWDFYLASLETQQLFLYGFVYLIGVFPIFMLTVSTEDYLFGVGAHVVWFFFLYLLIIRNGFIRGKCLKRISKIAVTDARIIELNSTLEVIRSVNYKNRKIRFRKRSAQFFDIEIRDSLGFSVLAKIKPFVPLDFGDNPSVYIVCKIKSEELGFYQEIWGRHSFPTS